MVEKAQQVARLLQMEYQFLVFLESQLLKPSWSDLSSLDQDIHSLHHMGFSKIHRVASQGKRSDNSSKVSQLMVNLTASLHLSSFSNPSHLLSYLFLFYFSGYYGLENLRKENRPKIQAAPPKILLLLLHHYRFKVTDSTHILSLSSQALLSVILYLNCPKPLFAKFLQLSKLFCLFCFQRILCTLA